MTNTKELRIIFLKKSKQFKKSYSEVLKSTFISEEDLNRLNSFLNNEGDLGKWLYTVKFKDGDNELYPIITDLEKLEELRLEISEMYNPVEDVDAKAIDTFCDFYPFKYSFDEFSIDE